MKPEQIKEDAICTINLQAESISGLGKYIDNDFVKAVQLIAACNGRLVVSGIGKSAIIAQKMVATLNSTGTPALFMHAADAIHGDLGMVQQNDIVLIISKSGDSPEIKVLVPLVKNFGNTIIGLVGNLQSYLAKHADIILNTTVSREACPNNLAPTTSTTAQLVMGDALAVCLMQHRQFSSSDFAKYHPGGALGKKLYLKVRDLVTTEENPRVNENANIKETILEITKKRLGATAVLNEKGEITGVVTDGDIRRMMEKHDSISGLLAKDIMGVHPKTIEADALAIEAFEKMKENNINQLLVLHNGAYFGIVHIQDLVREGII